MAYTLSTSEASRISQRRVSDQNIVSAAKGGGITFAGTVFAYGARFMIGILLARSLGAEQYGLYSLATTAVAVAAALALLGMESAMVRYVSLFVSRRDTAGLRGTLEVGLGLTTVTSLLTGIGMYALAGPIAERLFHEPALAPLLRLATLMVPFESLNSITAAATRGFKKMQYSAITQQVSRPLIKLVVLVVLAITVGLNAARTLAAQTFALVIACAMILYFLNHLCSLRHPIQTARRDVKGMLNFALPLYVTRLITMFRGNIQTVFLGALNTITSVGIFTVAAQVNRIGQMFHHSVVIASMPIVSELYGRRDREQMGRFYQTMARWTFTLNLPLFLVVLLFPTQILSVFGKSYVGGATALGLLAWANLATSATGIGGVMIDMTGRTRLKVVNAVVVSTLVVGLNALLIPRWGLTGAATAALVSAVTGNLLALLEVFALFRLLPYNVSFLKPVAAGLAALGVALALSHVLHPEEGLVYAAVNAAVLVLVYVGMILVLGLSDEDRVVLARLRGRLSNMHASRKTDG